MLAKERHEIRGRDTSSRARDVHAVHRPDPHERRGHRAAGSLRKGAVDAIARFVDGQGGAFPEEVRADRGGRRAPRRARRSSVADGARVLGVVELKDIVKGGHPRAVRRAAPDGHPDRDDHRRQPAHRRRDRGARPASTTSSPRRRPRRSSPIIREEQARGHLVAMTGDGTNDAPALAQADVAVAMNTGTQAAKEAGNMVDLDSNPTKLIEIVEIGKQLLMTRGALTTFSIANDVAKYFAIIPAAFVAHLPARCARSTSCGLALARRARSSRAVIFNALIIVALIPLALRGDRLPARAGAA